MSETGEGLHTKEIIKKESEWSRLDDTTINFLNSRLKENQNTKSFYCIPEAISFRGFNSETVGSLYEMLSDSKVAGSLIHGEVKNIQLQVANEDGSNICIIFGCELGNNQKLLESVDRGIGRVNSILKNINTNIQLPVRHP